MVLSLNPARALAGLALLGLGAGPALAQPKGDPDWPCVQRKVSTLSPGTVWTGPDREAAGPWGDDFEAAASRVLKKNRELYQRLA